VTTATASSSSSGATGGTSSSSSSTSSSSGTMLVPAFYVATNGVDSNPGTLASPFATLGAAQLAMEASSTHGRLRWEQLRPPAWIRG
jgi:hypothetical protein